MKNLKNKSAVITGGSTGIGFAIAEKLAQAGVNVLLLARRKEQLESAKDKLCQIHTGIHTLSVDLSDTTKLKAVSDKVLGFFPCIDILVNNAGIGRFIPFEEMDEQTLNLHLDLNVKAMYLLTKYLFHSIKDCKGTILNISSYFSHRMLSGRMTTAYSMSKGAVDAFTKSLAFEVGKYGVRVNAIAPGSVKTAQLQYNYNQLTDKGKKQFDKMIKTIYPLGRIGEPQDIAAMALFLVSDSAKWITGSVFSVDGGLTTN